MKKLLKLVAIIGITFFTSCEKEITNLTGTTWGLYGEYEDGSWLDVKITFTNTHATITDNRTNISIGTYTHIFKGTYTYDPPNVEIVGDDCIINGVEFKSPFLLRHTGTVKGRTMTLFIMETPDVFTFGDYKKL